MAKGKNSTALFEVIHTAKRPPKASPSGGIATPQWWFKSKKRLAAARRAGDVVGENTQDSKPSFFSRWSASKSESPRVTETSMEPSVIAPRMPDIESPPIPSPLALEKGGGEIKFKLSYGGAVAAAFVLVLLLAIVYLAGSRSPRAGVAETTSPDSSSTSSSGESTAVASDGTGFLAAVGPASQSPIAEVHRTMNTAPAVSPHSAAPMPAAPKRVNRQVGLHYIIAQSYASKEMAQKACDFLNQSGIACTVVQGPPGWAVHNWYSVVGVKSFDHVQHNPELEAYKHQVETLGIKFAGNIRFNRFEPNAYKWRAEADQQE